MSNNDKKVSLDEFEDIRRNIAFHFTSQSNMDSILEEGLRPQIGDNSSGGLGQSAIEKTYLSYGIEGVLQLYNRLLVASFGQSINDFNGISHKPFLPDSAFSEPKRESLSKVEGFEFIRQYMEDNVYFVFDAPVTQYEGELKTEDISEINAMIPTLEENGINLKQRHKELDKQITKLVREGAEENKSEILQLVDERNRIAIYIREQTMRALSSKRGKLLNEAENPIMEQVDYNDERLVWINQIERPHNAHTRIVEEDGKPQGVRITNDRLRIFSHDDTSISNGLDFLDASLGLVDPAKDQIFLDLYDKPECHDCNLLYKFQEYLRLVEQYKAQGLLDLKPATTYEIDGKTRTVPERYVMDMTNIEKYPGLQDFMIGLDEYYEEHKYRKPDKTITEHEASENNTNPMKEVLEAAISRGLNNTDLQQSVNDLKADRSVSLSETRDIMEETRDDG